MRRLWGAGAGLTDADGVRHEMAGLLGLETSFAKRRMHLGYRLAELAAPMPGHQAGARLRGHEFHYSTILARKPDTPLAVVRDATGAVIAETGSRRGPCHRHVLPSDRGGPVSGFVSFISAGPGDPDLLTLKGAARLREADVVLYDDLASGAILDLARPGANLVAVGKRAGRPSTKQHHVNRLLVDYAATGSRVVRLKSGDAGIFGRLEEELETLREAGIGYEIIPGVTSACVAAAQAGIPRPGATPRAGCSS